MSMLHRMGIARLAAQRLFAASGLSIGPAWRKFRQRSIVRLVQSQSKIQSCAAHRLTSDSSISWHSYVCASPDAVMRAMSREGYTPCVSYLNQSLPDLSWGDYWEFENPRDLSQTAIATAQRLVE